MSQHSIPGYLPGHVIMVGYDPPLETFFVEVYTHDRATGDDHLRYWRGTHPYELASVEALVEAVAPYAVLSAEVHAQLQHDYERRTRPTPLQQAMRARMRRGRPRIHRAQEDEREA
jgi:hypothetical protein